MATAQGIAGSTEAAIVARIVHPEKDDLPKDIARGFLRLSLDQTDLGRLHEGIRLGGAGLIEPGVRPDCSALEDPIHTPHDRTDQPSDCTYRCKG
jgi:hypothetical protein